MSQPPTSALCTTWDWTTTGADLSVTVGATTHPVNLPTGTYTTYLAPHATEPLAVLTAALNTAFSSSPTFVLSINPATGLWTISINGPAAMTATWASGLAGYLGAPVVASGGMSMSATRVPRFVLLFAALVANDWTQQTALASSTAEDGTEFAVTSGITRWGDEITISYIPAHTSDQTVAGSVCNPWFPDDADLAGSGIPGLGLPLTVTYWDIADHLIASLGRTQSLARGNWPTLAGTPSATVFYDLVTIPGKEAAAPRVRMQFPSWSRFRTWTTKVHRLALTPVGTRM